MGRDRALTDEPTLTWRQLNRAVLARQGLLERTSRTLPAQLAATAGLQAQYAPAPVRFLPTWDATLLVHARRARILEERHRPLILSTKNPHSVPTFLVDGTVADTWRYTEARIEAPPFEPLDTSSARAVRDQADALVRLFD